MSTHPHRDARPGPNWIAVAPAVAGLIVVAWAVLTEWGGIVHAHPAYGVGLALIVAISVTAVVLGLRRRVRPGGPRLAGRIALAVAGTAVVGGFAWARPHTAVEPALAAMQSDSAVTVTETATRIVLEPNAEQNGTALFFQPGALVDARAYAAVLRPVAESGHTVVIPKQPMGIAFLALGALDGARDDFPEIDGWVVGGHSLGGTVASMEADETDDAATSPALGLLLFASYPAGDISGTLTVPVMSISGTQDGLATPAKIEASKPDLPADTEYVVIDGGSHAQFGAYGPQAGDNTPTISNDDAREQISTAAVDFLESL